MNVAYIILLIAFVAVFLFGVFGFSQYLRLRHKLRNLGDVRGRSYNDLVAYLGKPSGREGTPEAPTYIWKSSGTEARIQFDANGIATGSSHVLD